MQQRLADLAKKNRQFLVLEQIDFEQTVEGQESGNTQMIKEILVDCDSDALVYLVKPSGPACHTGEGTCFHNTLH